jgi:hypothetical protein
MTIVRPRRPIRAFIGAMTRSYDFNMPLEDAMLTQRAIRRSKPNPVD